MPNSIAFDAPTSTFSFHGRVARSCAILSARLKRSDGQNKITCGKGIQAWTGVGICIFYGYDPPERQGTDHRKKVAVQHTP